jgi:DNA-binding MarR family transcriptional regulator
MNEEWITMTEAADRLKIRRTKISRLAARGVIQTKENPLDARVKLVNFTELRALFDQYGPRLGDDDE